jgi:hypothetical protein
MSEATSTHTPGGGFPPFTPELIDLTDHPDATLLQMCAVLAKTRDAVARLETAISRTAALTLEGRRMKGLSI